jgi:cardiolipin synthase
MDLPYQIYSHTQEAMDAMYQAILAAKKSVYWEVYAFVDDEAGNPFFNLLEEKARAGIDIKVIVDSMGSSELSDGRVRSLRSAGVDIRFFQERAKKFHSWWKRLWTRTHRKILIVDESVGFIGGVNIKDKMRDWLDIHVRLEGKMVHSLLRAFAKSYVICGGDKKLVRHLLKYNFRLLHDRAEFVFDSPNEHRSAARRRYSEALLKARERVILFSPYYFPDKKFLYALWRARKRGIKVDLLLPLRSDIRLLTFTSRAWFSLMDKLGVKIHLTDKMMHGKGVIMDDEWAMIGSSNLEQTGFYDNYEANVRFKNKKIVKKIKETLLGWIDSTEEFSIERWKQRGWWQKGKEKVAVFLYRLWHGKR